MKVDHQNLTPLHHRRPWTWQHAANQVRNNNHKCTVYVIFLIFSYVLGYFCASSSTRQIPPPTINKISPITESTIATNCLPATSAPTITDKNNEHNRFGTRCGNPVQPDQIRSTIIKRVFNGSSPYENFPPVHVGHLLKPKRVKGWGSYGSVFSNLISKVRPSTIIEVGTFLGASATHMAELTRQLGLKTQILCIDDFRGWPGFRDKVNYVPTVNGDVLLYHQFIQNVIYVNSSESILPVPYSTGSALQKLCEWGVLAELIEVDAGHDFHSAWSDINRAHKLLRPGGVMFGHDYFTSYDNKGVRRAVDLFARVHGFKVRTHGQHWVLE